MSQGLAAETTTAEVEVAYLVTEYPAPSHVFIEREIEGLRALGARVETFTVRPTPADRLLSATMVRENARTLAIQGDPAAVLATIGRLARRRPGVLLAAALRAVRTGEATARSRIWQGFYLAEAIRLHAELERRGLRHIHVHFPNNSADIARAAVAIGRAKDGPDAGWRWTVTVHGPTEFEAVARFDLAAKVRSADAVACISDFTRSQLMRLIPTDDWAKLRIVRMSVDISQYRPVRRVREPGEPLRVLCVGRLVPEKASPVLVEAIADLVRRGREVHLRLVGSGPLAHELQESVARLGLEDRVELLGPVGQEELPALYEWADVFCLPSFQEGLPVVLMEAMATGLPVVTTGIAGIPELVQDGVNGRVVPPGRSDLVAEALESLALDPAGRDRFGREGRLRVETQHSVEVTAKEQLSFLVEAAVPRGIQSCP